MAKVLPSVDSALIYERADGVVYARYQDPTYAHIPRWIIGGDPDAVARAKGQLLTWNDWEKINKLAKTHPALKQQMSKLLDIYYLIKDQE